MMEACSTHGPVDVMRKRELRSLFDGLGRSYTASTGDKVAERNLVPIGQNRATSCMLK